MLPDCLVGKFIRVMCMQYVTRSHVSTAVDKDSTSGNSLSISLTIMPSSVFLCVYDLSNGIVGAVSKPLLRKHFDGIW